MAGHSKSNKYKVRVMLDRSVIYHQLLQEMRNQYLKEDEPNHLVVPYVILCALALEATLNGALTRKALSIHHADSTSLTDAFCSMSFKGKLNALVPLLTNGKFRINQQHRVYKQLASLITVRNRLAHSRSRYEDMEFQTAEGYQIYSHPLPEQYQILANDLTLGANQPYSAVQYHQAIEELERWFFRRLPDKLTHVDLVRAVDRTQQAPFSD